MNENTIFTLLLLFYALYISTKLFVSFSQIRFLRNFAVTDDGFDAEELTKAREYATAKERFAVIDALYEGGVFCFWIFAGLGIISPLISQGSVMMQTLGLIAFLAIGFLLEMPVKIAVTFGLDKKFGFTATTVSLFIGDKLKELALTLIVGGLLSFVAIYFISSFELWWLAVFTLIAVFMLGANILYPNFIAPLFNKFEKLQDEELALGLKELAHKSGFELNEIYRVDAGKRDTRLNAYFAGLGRTKRVTLYDTLLAKLSHEQIFAVVAHELGHFKHKHIIASLGIMLGAFFALTFLLGTLNAAFYDSLALAKNGAGAVVVFLLFSTPILYFAMPLINFVYKKNEFEADRYAAAMGLKDAMIEALKILSKENKAFPYASKIKIFFDYTHPPITQRIEKLNNG
jgi:STE24 endopeptidase